MHIHIQEPAVYRKMQRRKRVLMLHHEGPIALFDAPGDHITLNISSIDKIVLKSSVSPGHRRFPNKARNPHRPLLCVDLRQIGRDLPAIDMVNHILQVMIARGVKLCLSIVDELEGNVRTGQSQTLHQIADITGLGHGGL